MKLADDGLDSKTAADPKSKGLTARIAVATGFLVAAVALIDAVSSFGTKTQSLTCSFVGSLPWCGSEAATSTPTWANRATYESLIELNRKAVTLFASLSSGGTKKDFPNYKATYDELIGGFTNLRMLTEARGLPPAPRPAVDESSLQSACPDDVMNCYNPTPHHLDKVISLLEFMRDSHQQGGLSGQLVRGDSDPKDFRSYGGFAGQYRIEMDSVFTFELALLDESPPK